ncbi:leucine-rich repeat-containing protein 51-like [Schistocerca americana]|uniref:leucine-rich repeat-containing protein 51-like n=1 Tax=Schistocerca americana TaxID=7009 RepID=UPI001F5005DE|nr:leucine-rich repeat-containing protein 51-like [Schistocerca americana]
MQHQQQQQVCWLGPPLDYSFRGLRAVEELSARGPRRGRRGYRRAPTGHYRCQALRLNNNAIASVQGLFSVARLVLEKPGQLTWLDLSFNQLSSLPDDLCHFLGLKILYLHGNRLSELSQALRVLSRLPQLYSLTLHGNPVQQRPDYRAAVLAGLPALRCLDFTNVTASERAATSPR